MEILRQLNLNGNPQVVPNGSLIYAKNIKLSDDGTYITNDDGFDTAFIDEEPEDYDLKVNNVAGTFVESINLIGINYTVNSLVGYINCPNEVVLLVYKEYTQNEETIKLSEIYRAVELKNSDKLALYKVPNAWKYDGGKIVGTYTYNVYNHLIIAIAESDASIDKQLITIDLNDSNNYDVIDKYSCAPNVPIANLTLNGKVKGNSMPHGLYKFFIRYEVSDKLYTNWFPIGASQYALSLDYKTVFNHVYATDSGGGNTKLTTGSFLVNTEKDSYYNFSFTINFNDVYSYIGFQIGYILQTEDTSVGRIWNGFSFNGSELSKSFIFNGGYIDEIDISDLTANVLNVYNVKALTEYNSKLYLANFKETDYNVDLSSYAQTIDTYLIKKVVDIGNVESASTLMNTWTYTINGNDCSITVPADVSSVRLKDFTNILSVLNSAIDWKSGFQSGVLENLGEDTRIVFSKDKLSLSPSLPDPYYTGNAEYKRFWEGNGEYRFGSYWIGNAGGEALMPIGSLSYDDISISKEEHVNNYSSYNTDNVIKSLMPYEVYAFYVHYVREDGSYTNGIPLENKIPVGDYSPLYKQIKDLTALELTTYHLDDIKSINEIRDKYLYEVFIRDYAYSKEYFGIYLDNNGKKLFRTNSGIMNTGSAVYMLRLGVRFENITYPPGYVGAFFSYEKVNALSVYQAYVTDNISNNSSILIKANDCESANIRYDGSLFIPHHKITDSGIVSISSEPYYSYINNAAPVLSNASINFEGAMLNRAGLHGGIAMNLAKTNQQSGQTEVYQPAVGIVGSIIIFNRSIYSNEVKELIPLGPITIKSFYGEDNTDDPETEQIDINDNIINYDINYPSFLTQDKILTYKDSIFINENGSVNIISDNVINPANYYTLPQYAVLKYVWKFSNVNLLALSIKKEPEQFGGVVGNDNNTINIAVKPLNASDLFKLESCYLDTIHKAYTNFNKHLQTVNIFTNVIRASYPIRNESGINSWRLLNPLSYYVIDNANGEIVNIFGAAKAFYIHTKNNLLVTTADAKLTAETTEININNNEIFNIEPKEIFTSDLGYGGLKYQECQLFSQFGYIWYDTERYKLFRFDNGHLVDINSGIDEILKRYRYEYCYINIDNENNRIFFAFKKEGEYDLTIGYDTLGNKWLSLYDFTFDRSIHTVNYCLFNLSRSTKVYKYSQDEGVDYCDYGNDLQSFNLDLPHYGTLISADPERWTVKYCCFDIIFNPNYNIPKVLDSISWVHELISRHILDNSHPAELELVNDSIDKRVDDLTDMFIDIYTDSTDSGLLTIKPTKLNDVADVNNPNGYKYPFYDKGVWNYSYFRNNITIPVTEQELVALAEKYHVNVERLKNVYKAIVKNGSMVYRSSDLRSLIYGKYIAVRFVYKNNEKLKFDNLSVNIKKY